MLAFCESLAGAAVGDKTVAFLVLNANESLVYIGFKRGEKTFQCYLNMRFRGDVGAVL